MKLLVIFASFILIETSNSSTQERQSDKCFLHEFYPNNSFFVRIWAVSQNTTGRTPQILPPENYLRGRRRVREGL